MCYLWSHHSITTTRWILPKLRTYVLYVCIMQLHISTHYHSAHTPLSPDHQASHHITQPKLLTFLDQLWLSVWLIFSRVTWLQGCVGVCRMQGGWIYILSYNWRCVLNRCFKFDENLPSSAQKSGGVIYGAVVWCRGNGAWWGWPWILFYICIYVLDIISRANLAKIHPISLKLRCDHLWGSGCTRKWMWIRSYTDMYVLDIGYTTNLS